MKKQELCQYLQQELNKFYNVQAINNICNYIWITLTKDEDLISNNLEDIKTSTHFGSWIDQLKKKIPVQYILHNSCFYGLDLEVNSNVLIPRPETEELVAWILSDRTNSQVYQVMDIGTGSGCIAVALKNKRPEWSIMAIDISDEALEVAKKNASSYKLDIDFKEIDFLESHSTLEGHFDIIVSNPPYISREESRHLSEMIYLEPAIALFPINNDPLIFYKTISHWSRNHLNRSGSIYVELNEFYFLEIRDIFYGDGFSEIEIRDDLQGKRRMMKIKF